MRLGLTYVLSLWHFETSRISNHLRSRLITYRPYILDVHLDFIELVGYGTYFDVLSDRSPRFFIVYITILFVMIYESRSLYFIRGRKKLSTHRTWKILKFHSNWWSWHREARDVNLRVSLISVVRTFSLYRCQLPFRGSLTCRMYSTAMKRCGTGLS